MTRFVQRALYVALALLGALVVSPRAAEAQQPGGVPAVAPSDTLYEVRLSNGETYVARVVAVQGDTLSLETTAGARVRLERSQVVSIRPARGRVVRGAYWHEDPNRSRLFFSPSGRMLRRGDGYFGVYEVYIPFVAYAPTDRVLLAGGSPFYLAFFDEGITPPVYFGPKVQVASRPGFDAAVGGLLVVVPDAGDFSSAGIAYGVGTFGSADNAVTTGLGWGYVDGEAASKPVLMLGGESRVSRSIKLITENVFVPGPDGVVYSGGVRFFGERLSADAGLMGFVGGGDGWCCFPLVNFVYNFGPSGR